MEHPSSSVDSVLAKWPSERQVSSARPVYLHTYPSERQRFPPPRIPAYDGPFIFLLIFYLFFFSQISFLIFSKSGQGGGARAA